MQIIRPSKLQIILNFIFGTIFWPLGHPHHHPPQSPTTRRTVPFLLPPAVGGAPSSPHQRTSIPLPPPRLPTMPPLTPPHHAASSPSPPVYHPTNIYPIGLHSMPQHRRRRRSHTYRDPASHNNVEAGEGGGREG